jgi:Ca2+-binding RTX toxin-like protein
VEQELIFLIGEAGNDTILGGLDGDNIYGGTFDGTNHTNIGNDTVDYSYITGSQAITADLSLTAEQIKDRVTTTNFDTLYDIENVLATKNADTLKGSDDFTIVNILDGYKGNDTFYASKGLDSFIGGEGIDTLDYSNVDLANGGTRVIVDLGLQKATDDGYHDGTTIYEDYISEIEIVKGTSGDDSLYGDSNANSLFGNAGDDVIEGREGADYLEGNAGADIINGGADKDTIYGGADNDQLTGGAGNDTLYGEAGLDTLIGSEGDDTFSGGADSDTLTYVSAGSSITVTLGNGSTDFGSIVSSTEGTDTLLDHIEIIRGSNYSDNIQGFNGTAIVGVDYSDTLYGESNSDIIYGGIGDDTIYGGSGDDIIRGQAGNDVIDGGDNDDTLDFSDANIGVQVYLDSTDKNNVAVAFEVMEDGFGGKDQVTSIEKIIGSNNADTIKGDSNKNTISSGDGDDTIIASLGSDTIDGGTHTAGTGGGDWLSFEALNSAVTAIMANGSISDGFGTTNISNIENLLGTILGDTLTGDANNNTLDGNAGDDVIDGGLGNDYLYGNAGDDTLVSSDGFDTYDGGTGENTLRFYNIEASIEVNLSTGTITNDGFGNTESAAITNIQNIQGTLNYADKITGDDNNNKIYGYGGNDIINGLGGFDTIYGGTGADTINVGTDTDNSSEDVAFGGEGIDTLIGNFDQAVLFGDSVGGTDLEEDWIDYSSSTSGITVDLSGNVASSTYTLNSTNDALDGTYTKVINNDSPTEFDLITQIENIKGTNQTDILGGDSSDNTIFAGAGDDTVFLSAGNDYLDGGTLDQTTGDWLSLEYYKIDVDLASTTDSLYNFENVLGSKDTARGETAYGDSANNTFIMYDGADLVYGRTGNDTYDLGAGNDIARANSGSDTLIAGAGVDRLDYNNWSSGSNSTKIILQNVSIDTNDDGIGDSSVTSTTQSLTVSGLSTLTDGSHTFFSVTDSTNTIDYIYQEADGTTDFEEFYLNNSTANGDTFVGDLDNNTVYGYAGNDTLLGMGGDDSLNGGEGNDLIYGGEGADNLTGSSGNDRLYGEAGNDVISGGDNDDTIWGGTGTNNLSGDAGKDTIHDQEGIDTINGGADEDTVIFKNGTQGINVNLNLNSNT